MAKASHSNDLAFCCGRAEDVSRERGNRSLRLQPNPGNVHHHLIVGAIDSVFHHQASLASGLRQLSGKKSSPQASVGQLNCDHTGDFLGTLRVDGLAPQAEARNERLVTLRAAAPQVIEQPAPPRDHLQQTPARMMVLRVRLEMLRQL